MRSSGVKFSGVKIVPQSDLRAGTTSGNSWQRDHGTGALEILTRELDRTGLDIIALQEVRWPGEGSQESGKFTLYYGGATKPEFGTGILVRRSILSAIRDIKFVSDRISYIILKGKRHDFIIVNVYGPTETSDDTIKDEIYEELKSVFDRLSRYHMKIFLGDFNAKVGREDIFRPTIGKFSLHEDSNDNGDRLVTFATSKNLTVKSTTFQHKDIHKHTWTSPDGQTRNLIDHVLVDKRWHSSIIDIRSVRGLDCNSDHHLVRKFELNNLRNDEVRLEYQIKITNRFETLECSEENVATEEENNINREWETIRGTIKLSASEIGPISRPPWISDQLNARATSETTRTYRQRHHSHPHSYQQGEFDEDDHDGQMMSGDSLGLKFPDICLMGEEKPQKNLTQETCPDRESNPGPLRERRIRYPLLHNEVG
ncbi:hypothetical protein C0J52_26535 [Blattella germanica]|nr:hypothetical protein C0J52_26535 [Blattella germanica]